jgi:hypothetical protein
MPTEVTAWMDAYQLVYADADKVRTVPCPHCTADVKVEPGPLPIQIYADSHVEASALHLVLT